MKFFILMPLVPGLILWVTVATLRHLAHKGQLIQAEKARQLAERKAREALPQPRRPVRVYEPLHSTRPRL